MRKLIICFSTWLAISAARGQVRPSDGNLILHELDRTPGKYVLSVKYNLPEKGMNSLVVIGDTFEVQSRAGFRGGVCDVIMSNAYVLQTKFESSTTNELVQSNMHFEKYLMPFPEHTKLIFKNSVTELQAWKKGVSGATNVITYEGDDALRQLKKMGMEPPPDMDMDKSGANRIPKSRP